MQEHEVTVLADRQSLAAGRDINVTIHVCELRHLLLSHQHAGMSPEEIAERIVRQCLARLTAVPA